MGVEVNKFFVVPAHFFPGHVILGSSVLIRHHLVASGALVKFGTDGLSFFVRSTMVSVAIVTSKDSVALPAFSPRYFLGYPPTSFLKTTPAHLTASVVFFIVKAFLTFQAPVASTGKGRHGCNDVKVFVMVIEVNLFVFLGPVINNSVEMFR